MIDVEAIAQELKTTRDEIKLKIHLGSKELQEEWDELEKKYDDAVDNMKLDQTAEDIGAAGELMIDELKKGFERIKAAVD
ncbi:MAG: hypothetical protein ACR2OJ_03185 [Hyphomicrobiales bacterium]